MDAISEDPKTVIVVLLAILLPILIGGVYFTQTRNSEASAACAPKDIRTERTSNSAGRVIFNTECAVKARLMCAIGRDGVQFACGEDEIATTTHVIDTSSVTLNSDTPYFVFIDTQLEEKTLAYIQASPVDRTVGLNFDAYTEDTVGFAAEEEGFDVSQDINQDGVVNMMDVSEFYPEF